MALDLSALDSGDDSPVASGKKLYAPHSMFYEDPDQPRKEIDPEADNKDREDIRRRGVLQAITVHPPGHDGRMKIIMGARRFRLSKEAGLPEVPYVIEDDAARYDDYAQVAENERRKNLSPMDLAVFIKKRKDLGDKNAYIAAQIGIDPSEITAHLVLVEAPEFITRLYAEHKCRTPKYLYDLNNLAKEFPDQVKEFCLTSDDFTRKAILNLSDRLKNLGNTKTLEEAAPVAPLVATPSPSVTVATDVTPVGTGTEDDAKPQVFTAPSHNPDNEKDSGKDRLPPDPSKMKKPLLLGTYKGDDVMVLLNKRPSSLGLAFVKYESGAGEIEVSLSDLTNLTLTESNV